MISKYVQFTDFMSRKNTSAYHNNYQASSTLPVFASNNSVMLVVAIVSCLSISLFGLGFFLKKKHR